MKPAFSRWPSPVDPAEHDSRPQDYVPSWMLRSGAPRASQSQASFIWSLVAVLVPASCAAAAAWSDARHSAHAVAYILIALVAAAISTADIVRRQGRGDGAAKLSDAAFDRAGISMWREDWSAVAEAIRALREAGIFDIEAHYAKHPEELRTLRARVFIKDVNSFTIDEFTGASKSDFVGSLDRILPDTDQTFVQWLVAFARGDRLFRSEAHVVKADGSVSDTLFTAALPQTLSEFEDLIVISIDITSYKAAQVKLLAAEDEMARVSRIATVGALTASIAHEVNGPLAAIMANAEAAVRWMRQPEPPLPEIAEALTELVDDAARATAVVERTRAFMSNTQPRRGPVDVVDCVRQANLLLDQEIRSAGATVHINAENGLRPAYADAIQLQQIFVNLILNAAQAMAGLAGRRDIRIDIRSEAHTVHVDVIDNGLGIEASRLNRIFEPFHSTKPAGMGMGLAIARASAEAQGGQLWASPQSSDRGAIFHLVLPIAEA